MNKLDRLFENIDLSRVEEGDLQIGRLGGIGDLPRRPKGFKIIKKCTDKECTDKTKFEELLAAAMMRKYRRRDRQKNGVCKYDITKPNLEEAISTMRKDEIFRVEFGRGAGKGVGKEYANVNGEEQALHFYKQKYKKYEDIVKKAIIEANIRAKSKGKRVTEGDFTTVDSGTVDVTINFNKNIVILRPDSGSYKGQTFTIKIR